MAGDEFGTWRGGGRGAGLSAVWRVAADAETETHYGQPWDSRTQVPEWPRLFNWVHTSGAVREIGRDGEGARVTLGVRRIPIDRRVADAEVVPLALRDEDGAVLFEGDVM